jgi:hypothetical protein
MSNIPSLPDLSFFLRALRFFSVLSVSNFRPMFFDKD